MAGRVGSQALHNRQITPTIVLCKFGARHGVSHAAQVFVLDGRDQFAREVVFNAHQVQFLACSFLLGYTRTRPVRLGGTKIRSV